VRSGHACTRDPAPLAKPSYTSVSWGPPKAHRAVIIALSGRFQARFLREMIHSKRPGGKARPSELCEPHSWVRQHLCHSQPSMLLRWTQSLDPTAASPLCRPLLLIRVRWGRRARHLHGRGRSVAGRRGRRERRPQWWVCAEGVRHKPTLGRGTQCPCPSHSLTINLTLTLSPTPTLAFMRNKAPAEPNDAHWLLHFYRWGSLVPRVLPRFCLAACQRGP